MGIFSDQRASEQDRENKSERDGDRENKSEGWRHRGQRGEKMDIGDGDVTNYPRNADHIEM